MSGPGSAGCIGDSEDGVTLGIGGFIDGEQVFIGIGHLRWDWGHVALFRIWRKCSHARRG
jgi:hypothetical protein